MIAHTLHHLLQVIAQKCSVCSSEAFTISVGWVRGDLMLIKLQQQRIPRILHHQHYRLSQPCFTEGLVQKGIQLLCDMHLFSYMYPDMQACKATSGHEN